MFTMCPAHAPRMPRAHATDYMLAQQTWHHAGATSWQNMMCYATCWRNMLMQHADPTCWPNMLAQHAGATCWRNMLAQHAGA